jgi:hypothetical protein
MRYIPLRVERSGEFDLDYDRFAMVPLTETVQPIGKIFKRSVLRQHERERTLRRPLSRGLTETRRDGFLASFPPKAGDRAGLALPRLVTAPERIAHSRRRDGCGRLGNYSVLSQTRSEKLYSARSQPVGWPRRLSKERYVFKSISRTMRWRLTIGPTPPHAE